MKIKALKLKNHDFGDQWEKSVSNRWNYADMLRDPHWRKDWISFDGVVHHPGSDRVYCGITSFDGDIFKAYDRRSQSFIDLGFAAVGNPYDAKFHRSMELSRDGNTLYCGTALLHDIDREREAPGGGVYVHDIPSGKNRKLGIPIAHNYIQSIVLHEDRQEIYCLHFTPERLSRVNLNDGKAEDLGAIGSGFFMAQGENLVIDHLGCVWSGWGVTRAWQSEPGPDAARLCKFDPKLNRIVYLPVGLPTRDGRPGFAKVEGLFNLGNGCLYASGDNGSLYRIDPVQHTVKYLGTPIADRASRLTSLALHTDGNAYGVTGRKGQCQLLKFDPRTDRFELGGPIVDSQGLAMYQCHDITVTPDGTLYAAENDNPQRSSHLWEIAGAL
jgi:hypothetical protein